MGPVLSILLPAVAFTGVPRAEGRAFLKQGDRDLRNAASRAGYRAGHGGAKAGKEFSADTNSLELSRQNLGCGVRFGTQGLEVGWGILKAMHCVRRPGCSVAQELGQNIKADGHCFGICDSQGQNRQEGSLERLGWQWVREEVMAT